MQESYKAGGKSIFQAKWLSKYDTLIIAMVVMVLTAATAYTHGQGIMLTSFHEIYERENVFSSHFIVREIEASKGWPLA